MCNGHHTPSFGSPLRFGLTYVSFATLIACTRGEVALHVKANAVNRGATTLTDELTSYLSSSSTDGDTNRLHLQVNPLIDTDSIVDTSDHLVKYFDNFLNQLTPKVINHAVANQPAIGIIKPGLINPSLINPSLISPMNSELDDDDIPATEEEDIIFTALRELQARHECESSGTGLNALHDCDDEDDHHDHEHELTWQRSLHVIGAALAMMLVSLVGMTLPNLLSYWGSKGSSTTRALIETLCTAFAAGGFWGLALIHMLLEAVTALQSEGVGFYLGSDRNFFNAAYILAAAGYMTMLGVQNFAVVLNAKAHRHQPTAAHQSEEKARKVALLDAAVSTIALTFHAFFEGLVCGMRDDATLIWVAAVSVMGHKWAESFSLAQRMRSSGVTRRDRIIFLTIFLLASPVGALIGLPLSALDSYATIGVLNSLSAGILIFVAGHCTEDVFGGHCHSHHLLIDSPTNDSGAVTNDSRIMTDDPITDDKVKVTPFHHQDHPVIVQAHAEREAHTHGHGPSHCTEEPDFSSSIMVFLGRMVACIAGTILVAGMMCVHMSHSAHSHAIE